MKRYTKSSKPVMEIEAVLVDKRSAEFTPVPQLDLSHRNYYELFFKTENGLVSLEVSPFEYSVVDIGMKGHLKYQGTELISFGDRIRELEEF